jgi:hypothetical protein
VELADIDVNAIAIDEAKAEYIAKKGVFPADIQEVHGNAPKFYLRNQAWNLYNMIGPNLSGRFLVVGIQYVVNERWRVVTAYWNDDGRAQRIYEG